MKTGLVRRGKLAGGLGLLLALALVTTLGGPALALLPPPEIPEDQQFWGSVRICDTLADPETVVTATIDGAVEEWTSVVVYIDGYDGYYGLNDPPAYPDNLMLIPADDPGTLGVKEGGEEGDTVEFWVLGRLAGEAPFEAGETTELPLQVNQVELTVDVVGNGDVEVEGVPPGAYPAVYTFDCTAEVDLEAIPATGWDFTGWSGDLSGTENPTTIDMDGDKTVTATFESVVPPEPHDLTVTSEGCCTILVEGLGTVEPGNTEYFLDIAYGTEIGLEAVPPDCCSFDGWEVDGGPVGGNPITVTMDSDHTAVATCSELGLLTLVIDVVGNGDVEVEGVAPGEYPETYLFECSTEVDLEAIPDEDWFFAGWSGDLVGMENPTTIHMDGNKTVTANFEPIEAKVLTVSSTAGGSVTSPDEAVSSYPGGTVVPLVADPDPCANFIGWTGDTGTIADVNAATTTIIMNDDYEIIANFVPPEVLKVVTLNEGWNTFSTPLTLNQCTDTWGKLEVENDLTGLLMIYRFDASAGQWDPIMSGPVTPLEGFYVKMTTEDETVSIIPDRVPPLIPPSTELSSGLNFIGPPSLDDQSVVTALLDIYEAAGGYSKVINPAENVPWPGGNTYNRDIPPVPIVVACNAYWVVMPNPGAILVGMIPPPL